MENDIDTTIVDYAWSNIKQEDIDKLDGHDFTKLLIDKIVSTESCLTTGDRQAIFHHFLQSIKLHTGLAAIKVVKPTYKPTDKEIRLASLSQVCGVNRLAKNQHLSFSKNITIITIVIYLYFRIFS